MDNSSTSKANRLMMTTVIITVIGILIYYLWRAQVLRGKVPTLVDRMLNTPLVNGKLSSLNTQIMNYVVEKPWEPALVKTPTH